MSTELRFLLAIGLMLLVLVGTNVLFPPVTPDAPPPGADSIGGAVPEAPTPGPARDVGGPPAGVADSGAVAGGGLPPVDSAVAEPGAPEGEARPPERLVRVESPLYRYTFSTWGAELVSAEMLTHRSLRSEGPVELIPRGSGALTQLVVVGSDTLDLATAAFEASPAEGLTLREGDAPAPLTLTYTHPAGAFSFEVTYTFDPGAYLVEASGVVRGAERPLLVTSLGSGLEFNEADSAQEASMMAYVGNHVGEGIRSEALSKVERPVVRDGPYLWAALKSRFFVLALLAGRGEGDYLGGLITTPSPEEHRAGVAVTQSASADGTFDYRLFMGPQDYNRLGSLGDDLEEVNPYGWRFFRPIIRPFVSIIMTILVFLHNTLSLGYGWVLIVFGVLMRVVLWPLNQKAMRAQMRNMAVQPLLKEIQAKHKDNPERLQKEMMKLYKEYGFNPLAGCLPMLLPMPVLIALFFVFQNTIELRGVSFLWLPDLSAHDPLYVLPVFLAVSMFLLQYISYKSMDQDNPQMKMMMWFMPLFLGFIFMRFPAGLNLYYATANVAQLPQQYWIAKERKQAKAEGPVKLSERE